MPLAVVWHYWIGVALVLTAVVLLVAVLGGYLARVTRARYPSRGQERRG
jgi:hypothetical protein